MDVLDALLLATLGVAALTLGWVVLADARRR